jgi:hypothetical protein
VSERNICIKHIWKKQEQPLALSQPVTVSSFTREALSLREAMSGLGRELLRTAATVVNQHRETPIFFTWKTSQLERKYHRPKPPKSSSTIIKWGYNKLLSREHCRMPNIKIHMDLGM